MSILTGFKKVKNYILTSSGYQLLSRWTSSQTVEFDDGKTAQTKLGEINGIAKTYVDMKKATDNSIAVSAKAVMEGLENSSALISMTQAEYDALSDEEKTDNNMRAILDANPDVVDAKNVNFDNTNTNLTATNTQSAITELNGKLLKYDKDKISVNKPNIAIGTNIIDGTAFTLSKGIYFITVKVQGISAITRNDQRIEFWVGNAKSRLISQVVLPHNTPYPIVTFASFANVIDEDTFNVYSYVDITTLSLFSVDIEIVKLLG